LGTALMSEVHNDEAAVQFKRVLELDSINQVALASLARLAYDTKNFDEARDWYTRLITVNPGDKTAFYSLGVIAWAKWYPPYMQARKEAGLKPSDPGPLPNPARDALKSQYIAMLDEGVKNLDQALLLDPQYSDAYAYKNLLIRERADLRDSTEEYKADTAVANDLVQKAMAAKKTETSQFAPGPPPPPPTPGATPTRIRVGGNVQNANLVTKVDPVYPPLALQARISGQVRFTVIINKEGTVENIQLVSGHPLLVAAATTALKQYVYKPTLLNGIPVEVITQVDVNFALNN
jgi:TonB family protein